MAAADPLISFIHLSRKLLSYDNKQLSQFIPDIVDVFDQSNQIQILSQIFLSGLTSFYKNIPQTIFEQIDDVLPNNTSMINDSINLSPPDNNDDKKEDTNQNTSIDKNNRILIVLPKDLHLLCFNYLELKDICSVSSVCRYLCITCRDPNAIYHLKIDYRSGLKGSLNTPLPNINSYYISTKSLTINCNACHYNKHEQWKISHFQNLKSLKISARPNLSVSQIPNNMELHTLKYDMSYIHGIQPSIANNLISLLQSVNPQTMKCLELNIKADMVNVDIIKPLLALNNLESLSLCVRGVKSENNDDIEITKIHNYNKSYSFPFLKEIEINSETLTHVSTREFFVWIMTNGIAKKRLKLKALNHSYVDTVIAVLPNVNELYLPCFVQTSRHEYIKHWKQSLSKINAYYIQNNNSSLNHFEFSIYTGWQNLNLLGMQKESQSSFCNVYEINKQVKNICDSSTSSRLICHSDLLPNYLFNETKNTNLRNTNIQYDFICKLMRGCSFDSVEIYLRNSVDILVTCREVMNYVSTMNDRYKEDDDDEVYNDKYIEELHREIIDYTARHTSEIIKRISKAMFRGKSFYLHLKHSHQYSKVFNDFYGFNASKHKLDEIKFDNEFDRFIKGKKDRDVIRRLEFGDKCFNFEYHVMERK